MAFGTSIFLIAVGAILTYAVEVDAEGINLDTVGIILMVVGAIGFLLSMLFWTSWAPFRTERRTYVRDGYDDPALVRDRDRVVIER